MQTILITGGTGLIGNRLVQMLTEKGWQVIILTRSLKGKKNTPNISYAVWDTKEQTIDIQAVQSADAVIHLAGAGVVDKRWTHAYKQEIVDSRVLAGKLIIDTLKKNTNKVKTIVSSSAIGWYGPDHLNANPFVETDPHANDFLGNTCFQWERSIELATKMNIRVCKLRTGIVLSNEGGALPEFKRPIKFGMAAILGNGRQVISWIQIDDLCRMYIYALENSSLTGSYNAVASNPVTNKALTLQLAKAMNGKFYLPMHVPAFALKLILGESSIEVLKSTTVSNEKIKAAGFKFLYSAVEEAIGSLLK